MGVKESASQFKKGKDLVRVLQSDLLTFIHGPGGDHKCTDSGCHGYPDFRSHYLVVVNSN